MMHHTCHIITNTFFGEITPVFNASTISLEYKRVRVCHPVISFLKNIRNATTRQVVFTYIEAYSAAGKIHLRQQVEDQKEHAI